MTPRSEPVVARASASAIAFLLISYAHVVFGEVVPKNLAIEKADRLAILVAPVLLVFSRCSRRSLFRRSDRPRPSRAGSACAAGHGGGGHSAEELKFIVSSSRREGHLHRFEEDAIQALLELSDYYAREIMVPRNDIVSVSVDASLDQVLRRMREHQYSRLPVYDGSPEHIIGYVHYKDMMRIWEERRMANSKRRPLPPFHLSRVLRKPLVVPETKPLNDLIDEFRETHIHMAMVVDEFGTIAGLVTLEDVLEQIFGEIGDEHDVKRPRPATEAPAWKWTAPSPSAIWTRSTAWNCRATRVSKRWPDSCSSSSATFPSRATRWSTDGANSPSWPWITIASRG